MRAVASLLPLAHPPCAPWDSTAQDTPHPPSAAAWGEGQHWSVSGKWKLGAMLGGHGVLWVPGTGDLRSQSAQLYCRVLQGRPFLCLLVIALFLDLPWFLLLPALATCGGGRGPSSFDSVRIHSGETLLLCVRPSLADFLTRVLSPLLCA